MKKYFSKLTAAIAALAITAMNMPMLVSATETATASTFTGENLLENLDPDFEGSSVASGWTIPNGGTAVVSTEQAKSGNQSLKVTAAGGQQISPTAASVTLKAGKYYIVSGWIYVSADGLYRLRVVGSTAWKQCYTGWNYLREVVTVANDTSVALYLQKSANSTETVYMDDLKIIEVGENLLSAYDPDFENTEVLTEGDTANWYIRGGSVSYDTTQKVSGSKSVKLTRSGAKSTQQCGPMARNVAVEAGKTYYASAWVYSGVAKKFRVRFQDTASNVNLPQTAWESVPANRWTCLGTTVECQGDDTALFYVQAADDGTAGDIVYVDNFQLYDITPPAPAATTVKSPLNGAQKVSVNTDLKLVFSQAVNSVAASNIQINGATVGTITPSADNKTFTVDLGTLTPNTTYNAKVTGVVDTNGNTVADTTFTFITAHAGYENILVTQGYDTGFETGFSKWSLKGTVTQSDKANTGAYGAFSTNRSGGGHIGPQAIVKLEEDTEYLLSAYVYTNSTGEGVKMRAQGADAATIPDFTPIEAGKWTRVTAITNTTGGNKPDSGQTYRIDNACFYAQTNTKNDVYFDDYEIVKIGRIPDSDKYVFANVDKKVTLYKAYTDKYSSMDDIADDIIGAADYDISVTDADGSGDWTTGDKLTLTPIVAGADYKKVYTVNVRDYYDSSTEALIVKGSDGIGDDFCHGDTITKAGKAFIEYRVENNNDGDVTPIVIASVYDKNGKFLEMDIADTQTIPQNEYKDFELEVTIPSNVEGATVKIMVWDGFDSMEPLMPAKVYTIDTNDFTLPTVISDGMVLQRNADAVIFGKAPEYSTVKATLSGGITAEYTVPKGDNEFFVELPMGDANTVEQTLTITAKDGNGNTIGDATRTGILVGDVYYGSGQSNMARQFVFTADAIKDGKSTLYTPDQYDAYVAEYKALGAELSDKNVRFYKSMTEDTSASRASKGEATLAAKETWRTIGEANIDDTYNVMVRMVANIKNLDEYKDVPIGIVACAQGGTIAAKWVSRDTILNAGFDQKELDEYETNVTRADSQWYWASHTDLYYDGARAVLPYTFKAAVWYQGQSDTSLNYDRYVAGVIHDIRESQKNDELPVLVLGLFGVASSDYTSCWSVQRLCQLNVANQLTNVYTTITNDTGDPASADTFHPANDADVANRAARSMLANVYGENINWRGPEFASVTYTDDSATISVNTNGGTLAKYDTTVGSPIFELTTDGGTTWTAANSIVVNGNAITVSNSSITGTVNGVRYAMTPLKVKCIYGTYTDALGANVTLPLVPFDTTYVPNTLTYK
ncbi:MAG: carbohydrate binding domain-containing protein [Clostridia bacterium]|nr:carbohydrate binding domain-containing protein [Clostridia bacterium]